MAFASPRVSSVEHGLSLLPSLEERWCLDLRPALNVPASSTAVLITKPTMSVYSATKFAVPPSPRVYAREAGDKLRVTIISPGFVHTNLADSLTNPEVKAQIVDTMDKMAISPDAIARAIAFAIEQPADVDVGEIVIRPTAQG